VPELIVGSWKKTHFSNAYFSPMGTILSKGLVALAFAIVTVNAIDQLDRLEMPSV
jgi:hypothetical protein